MSTPEPPPWMDDAPWGNEDHAPAERPAPRIVTEHERAQDDLDNGPDMTVWWSLKKRKLKGVLDQNGDAVKVPQNTSLNVYNILRSDRRWAGGIRLSAFDHRMYVREPGGEVFEEITDAAASRAVLWIEQVYELVTDDSKVAKQMAVIAHENLWHPVRDYLNALEWDGTPRIASFVHAYLKGEDTEINAAYSRCWMVSAVARILEPGCKVDTTLVLVGEQGDGKSTALRKLCPDEGWWSESGLMLGSKDIYDQVTGVWLYEIPEIDSFRHKDWSEIKRFMSNTVDSWRKPYTKFEISRPRQVVFFGTTNQIQFLHDETGSRRFWPVVVTNDVDVKAIIRDRDQLWAEAVYQYRKHAEYVAQAADRIGSPWQWWLTEDEEALRVESSDLHQGRDVWFDAIERFMRDRHYVPSEAYIADQCLKRDLGDIGRQDGHRIKDALAQLGYRWSRPEWNDRTRGFYSPQALLAWSTSPTTCACGKIIADPRARVKGAGALRCKCPR